MPALEPFDSREHRFEVCWDGLRTLAFITPQGLELRDRRGRDMLPLFPELAGLEGALDHDSVVDGEVAICDAQGRPDADALALRLQGRRTGSTARAARSPAVFIAYDLLYLRGAPLLLQPLTRRQAALRENARRIPRLCLPDVVEHDGIAFFDAAADRGLSGIIAKREDSRYVPGSRSPDWLVIEAVRRDDFLVVGWLPGAPGAGQPFEAIALATHDQSELRYVGQVAGGFEARDRERIMAAIKPLFRATSPAVQAPVVPNFRWVEPRVVVRVKFSEWSPDRRLRFPIFVALREDVAPHEVQAHPGLTVPPAHEARRQVVVPTLPIF